MILLIVLQLFAVVHACSLHKSVSCRDETIASRSNYTTDVQWDADPALRYDYQYTQSDERLLINLKAKWRVLKTEKYDMPLTAFEISLLDITDGRMVEVRKASITSPSEGIRSLTETVEFATNFEESLNFGHDYLIELRLLPLGSNGSFKKRLSIPTLPASGNCERNSSLAHDKDKYFIFVSDIRKYPLTSTVLLAFYIAPPVFCFSEYTIEVHETTNPIAVYAKMIVVPTAPTKVVRHEFTDLPVGIHLSIRIYPTEVLHARSSQCVCSRCNCLVTKTKSFMFSAKAVVPEDSSPPEVPSITDDSSYSYLPHNLTNLLLILLLIVIIAMFAVITRILRIASKPLAMNVKLIADCNREEKAPIAGSTEVKKNGSILVIGLNSTEEHQFIHKLSSHLHPSTRLIFAPDDLPDGENKWKWMAAMNGSVDSIILLLREFSLALYAAGKSRDPFDSMFIEQMTLLHPCDHRIITVALDECNPSLFSSTSIVYRDPRDFALLSLCLCHRGFQLAHPLSPPLAPPLSTPLSSQHSPPLSPPISPSPSIRSESMSEMSLMSACEDAAMSRDSGFNSNSSSSLSRSVFPWKAINGRIPPDYSLVAN